MPAAEPAPEFRFGEGRASGVLSVALGALSILAVLCFRFPDVLTTPDLRAALPIGLLRGVLFAALLLGLGLGLTSVVLARRRGLGHLGIVLSGVAVLLGGAWVETGELTDRTNTLGLDWFVLNLLVLAVVFVPLERAFALRPAQRVLRDGFRTDLSWFFVSHLLVQVTVFLTMAPAALFFGWAVSPGLQSTVSDLPLWVQVPLAVFVADLFQYGIHRLFHRVPFLWCFHAIHHSSRELDWLAGSRLHLVDVDTGSTSRCPRAGGRSSSTLFRVLGPDFSGSAVLIFPGPDRDSARAEVAGAGPSARVRAERPSDRFTDPTRQCLARFSFARLVRPVPVEFAFSARAGIPVWSGTRESTRRGIEAGQSGPTPSASRALRCRSIGRGED